METEKLNLKDGDQCAVVKGTHAGKTGTVRDIHASKSGNITITVVQANGVRFKTLGRNVTTQRSATISAAKTSAQKTVVKKTVVKKTVVKKTVAKKTSTPRTTGTTPSAYHAGFSAADKAICRLLLTEISENLPDAESKIWHGHPVWFLDGNPIVGYSKLKDAVRLLFWSGQSFAEPGLRNEGSFKAAEVRYTDVKQVNVKDLARWLEKAQKIQWDYKNIVRRKGRLERLK